MLYGVTVGECMLGQSRGNHTVAIFLVAIMLASLFVGAASPHSELNELPTKSHSNGVEYTLYLASAPGGHPTDGRITTERPDGSQEEESASGTNVEFSTDQLLTDMVFSGDSDNGQWKVDIKLWLKATGQDGSTVDWTVSLVAGTSIIATEEKQYQACTPSAGGLTGGGTTCEFGEKLFEPSWTGNSDFTVDQGERLKVVVSADMDCTSGGGDTPDTPNGTDDGTSGRQWPGGGGNTECDAWVAWDEIDNGAGFSEIEIDVQPLAGSQVKVQRPGAVWTDPEVETWYPNDDADMRIMQFNLELLNGFGREDIDTVTLTVIDKDGQIAKSHTFDENEIDEDGNSQRAQYNWTYPGGIESGEYEVDVEVRNTQGETFLLDHDGVTMSDFGISLTHGSDRVVEYIAPSSTTPVNLDLRHVGASGSGYNLTCEMAVLTNFGSNWIIEFDQADRIYPLSGGGNTAHPTLLLTAPDDLSGSPDVIEIRAVAYDSQTVMVHQTTLQLDLEKLDTYAPPMVSLWPEEHDNQYANSTGALNIDDSIPRYVEDGVYTTFYLEIFNTGFDTDQFRIDVKQDSNANLRFWDNDTGQRIEENEGDGTFHTSSLDRHTTQTIRLQVKPSTSRDDADTGMIELETISIGNSTQKATIAFTIQRTFGIQAEVVYDCDSTPFGHVEADICLNSADKISFDIDITNTMAEGSTATDWLIVNPKDLDRNIDEDLYSDANANYSQWVYEITDTNEDPSPRVQLAPGDSQLINLDITLTAQVPEGNHTIYLRIREDISDSSLARYFDLPLTILIGKDKPQLSIRQQSATPTMVPGEITEIQMKVKNDGNTDVMVLLDVDVSGDWDADVISQNGAQVVTVNAFSEVSFTVTITAGDSALNGDNKQIFVTAKPLSEEESFPEQYTAEQTLNIRIKMDDKFEVIVKELTDPRPATIAIGLGMVILLVAAISGRRNRVEYVDVWVDEDDEESGEGEFEMPDLVTADDDDAYDEDDIELVDLD